MFRVQVAARRNFATLPNDHHELSAILYCWERSESKELQYVAIKLHPANFEIHKDCLLLLLLSMAQQLEGKETNIRHDYVSDGL